MDYFLPIQIDSFNHIPRCSTWIDRSMDNYALNFAASGTFLWGSKGTEPKPIQVPVLYWTLPGIRYQYGCKNGESWDQRWIAFKGQAAERMHETGLIPDEAEQPLRTTWDVDSVINEFDRLLYCLANGSASPQGIVVMLEGLLLHLHDHPQHSMPGDPLLRSIRKLAASIDREPCGQWNFQEESNKLCISYSHFRKMFSRIFGCAPYGYVLKSRLKQAASDLRLGNIPVKRCAYRAGFEDLQYFSRLFRNHFGDPPARYARKFRMEGQ